MAGIKIRAGTSADAGQLVKLVTALAKFEHLRPPSEAGKKRLLDDLFSKKRIGVFVAADGKKLVGYALYFYSYSSFLAKPTLYLEDLFVIDECRKRGVGFMLLRRCVRQALSKGCGRMEWTVLTWNKSALAFYERLGARRMSEWYSYRLDEESLKKMPERAP